VHKQVIALCAKIHVEYTSREYGQNVGKLMLNLEVHKATSVLEELK
jgi:hypothetical protein